MWSCRARVRRARQALFSSGCVGGAFAFRRSSLRNPERDDGLSGTDLDAQPALGELGSLAHCFQAEMSRPNDGKSGLDVETHAVVGHGRTEPVLLSFEDDLDPRSIGMFACICECLLADPVSDCPRFRAWLPGQSIPE